MNFRVIIQDELNKYKFTHFPSPSHITLESFGVPKTVTFGVLKIPRTFVIFKPVKFNERLKF